MRADVQIAGRGRRGRRWEAPAGTALLVSILLRPVRPVHEIPVLSLAGGIAAVECARTFGADARLSWPNDVVCEGRKLGGVLAELGPDASVLLGVGMNLSSEAADLPAPDRLVPTSLLLETGSAPTAPAALTALLAALQPLAELFDLEGPAAIAARARPLDALGGLRGAVAARERRDDRGHGVRHRRRRQPARARRRRRARVRERRGRAPDLSV